jgi:tyrosine-protein kinase Etk/Wzc
MESYKDQIRQDDKVDIKKFIFKIIANWYWFAITIFISLALAYYINRYSDPIYRLSATVLIKDQSNAVVGGVESIIEDLGMFRRGRKRVVENEIGIIQSYSMVRKAIEELGFWGISYFSIGRIRTSEIYNSSPILVVVDTGHVQKYNQMIYISLIDDKEYLLEMNDGKKVSRKLMFGETYEDENFKFAIFIRDFKNFDITKKQVKLSRNVFYY